MHLHLHGIVRELHEHEYGAAAGAVPEALLRRAAAAAALLLGSIWAEAAAAAAAALLLGSIWAMNSSIAANNKFDASAPATQATRAAEAGAKHMNHMLTIPELRHKLRVSCRHRG